jgi:diguanylate cyclase (GGDEF)-like protein/PAS domain S-box-containing protein
MVSTVLGEILTPNIVGVPVTATMRQALKIMRQQSISSVVVHSRGKPAGILTERGILAAMGKDGQDMLKRKVQEVMSSPVLTAGQGTPIHQAFAMLSGQGIRHLVVVDDKGKAVGMVTHTNMIQNLGVEYFLEIKRVSQIMSREVATVGPGEGLGLALKRMSDGPLSCLLVVDGGKPVGILTERDMVRFIAEGQAMKDLAIAQVMTSPVLTVSLDTPVHQAAMLMTEKKIRRLVVVDKAGAVKGIVTQSDMVKGMEARYVEMLREVIREKDELLRDAVDEVAKKTVYLDTILNSSLDMGIAASDGRTMAFINQAAQDILGVGADKVIGRDVLEFHREIGLSEKRLKRALSGVKRGKYHVFNIEKNQEGLVHHIEARVSGIGSNGQGHPRGFVIMVRDVTERYLAEQTIKRMAYHDALTGLPNRFLVSDRLEQGLASAARKGCMLALMLLDLDRFKQINDTLGHNIGDLLLRQVADRLKAVMRKSDTVGRMGGDEFLVILPEVEHARQAATVAEKLLKVVAESRRIAGHELTTSTSLGLAMYPDDGTEAQTLIKKADMALYMAKDAGRNTYRFYSEGQSRKGQAFRQA